MLMSLVAVQICTMTIIIVLTPFLAACVFTEDENMAGRGLLDCVLRSVVTFECCGLLLSCRKRMGSRINHGGKMTFK